VAQIGNRGSLEILWNWVKKAEQIKDELVFLNLKILIIELEIDFAACAFLCLFKWKSC